MVFAGHSNVVQITKIKVIKLLCCLRLYQNFLDRPRRILMDTWHARDQGVGMALCSSRLTYLLLEGQGERSTH